MEVDVPVPVYTGIILVTPPGYKGTVSQNPAKTPVSGTNSGAKTPVTREPKPKVPDPDKPVR